VGERGIWDIRLVWLGLCIHVRMQWSGMSGGAGGGGREDILSPSRMGSTAETWPQRRNTTMLYRTGTSFVWAGHVTEGEVR
jgi:hypothetical protein